MQTIIKTAVGCLVVQNKRRLFLIGLVVVFGLVDYVAPAVLDAAAAASLDALAYVAVGILEGQFAALAVWAALGPHRLVVRFTVALTVVVIWLGALGAGFSNFELNRVPVAGGPWLLPLFLLDVSAPLFLLVLSAPLSVMRVVRGWRLEPRLAVPADAPGDPRQFSVVELLVVTAVVVVAVWWAHVGLSNELSQGGGSAVYFRLLLACLMMVACSAFATVPAVWTVLGDRGHWKGAAILLAYAGAVTVVVVPPIKIFTQDPLPLGDIYLQFSCLHGGLLLTLLPGLLLIRSAGYVLPGRQRRELMWVASNESFRSDSLTMYAPLMVAFAAFDFLMPAMLEACSSFDMAFDSMWSTIPMMVIFGVVQGQFGVLAVWTVLGPERLGVRLAAAPFALAVLYGSLMAGVAMLEAALSGGSHTLEFSLPGMARQSLVLPLLLLAVSLPLWLVRLIWGWRIVPGKAAASAGKAQSRQFGITQLFGLTAALAVALSLARWGLKEELKPANEAAVYMGLFVTCLMATVWVAFTTIPAVWSVLATRRWWKGVAWLVGYAVAMTLAAALLVAKLVGGVGQLAEAYWMLLSFHGGLLLTLVASLAIARDRGFVLLRRASRRKKQKEARIEENE